jgi:hypothetical protein
MDRKEKITDAFVKLVRKEKITDAFVKLVMSEDARGEIEPGVVIEIDDNLEIRKWCRGADGFWREPASPDFSITEEEMASLIPDLTPPG